MVVSLEQSWLPEPLGHSLACHLGKHAALPNVDRRAGIFIIVAAVAFKTQWPTAARPPAPTTHEIGRLFLGEYLLAFEAASVLLLVALIGAAMIVRRKKDA